MNLEEYIRNPMGKGNAVYSQRFVYEELYTKKFNLLIAREAGIWKTQCIIANDKEYYFYIQIPSESVEHFFWDTVIQFTTKDGELEKSPSLKNYDIKFFSNDPAFMFNFARAFDKNHMLIEKLKKNIPKTAFKLESKVRNPQGIVGYVKSLYFAYLYIKLRGLYSKPVWRDNKSQLSIGELSNRIVPTDRKLELYNEAKNAASLRQRTLATKKSTMRATSNSSLNKPVSKIRVFRDWYVSSYKYDTKTTIINSIKWMKALLQWSWLKFLIPICADFNVTNQNELMTELIRNIERLIKVKASLRFILNAARCHPIQLAGHSSILAFGKQIQGNEIPFRNFRYVYNNSIAQWTQEYCDPNIELLKAYAYENDWIVNEEQRNFLQVLMYSKWEELEKMGIDIYTNDDEIVTIDNISFG